ncbi:MAG TPA: chitobiase/beta-hexosaminidase C-terminal domain-containing protein [Opitutaceae bacterium]|nr:chitobiase/beta-hexosaminidase C-terminal domain-containing protein [Opitutaceae bacterium]
MHSHQTHCVSSALKMAAPKAFSFPSIASALLLAAGFFACPVQAQDVLTDHGNVARTGVQPSESILTPQNVNQTTFGKRFSLAVDGYVYAQPLYVSNYMMADGHAHNVLFVATEHDSVYAFDADGANPAAGYLWKKSLLNAGETTVPSGDVTGTDLTPEIGITSTPVIDRSTGTLYTVTKVKSSGSYFHRIHALNLADGAEKFNGPTNITASGFDALVEHQRSGLLLANGAIWITWASHGDGGSYHGFLIGYNAADVSQQVAALNLTPNGSKGGIWLGGGGPSYDGNGNMYICVANGTFDANSGGKDYGSSALRMALSSGNTPSVADYFTPANQASLTSSDADFGAGSPILLPDQTGSLPHLMVTLNKNSTVYLMNRDNLGKYNGSSDTDLQNFQPITSTSEAVKHDMAFFNNTLYYAPDKFPLLAYAFNPATERFNTTPVQTSHTFTRTGSVTVSANGTANAIAWVIDVTNWKAAGPAVLYAYDATNIGASPLYTSSDAANNRDLAGGAVKMTAPTVANGMVYIGGTASVTAYGLLNVQQQVAAPVFSPVGGTYVSTQSVTITTSTIGASIRYTTDGSTPSETNGTLYPGTPVAINSTTTLKAIAFESGFTDSTVTSTTYTITAPTQTAAPVFNPAPGTYGSAQNVAITSTTSGASIRYTTDGVTTPSETVGTLYSSPVSISSNTTLKAIAYASGFTDSNVTSGSYVINIGSAPIQLEAESLSPVGTGATVSISNDANASGGVIEFLNSTAAGQSIRFTTPPIPAGTYLFQLRYKTNTTRGQATVVIDGTQVGGTIDQYAKTSTYITVTLGDAILVGSGPHTIVMNVTGKNSAATQFYITADKFTFILETSQPPQAAAPVFNPSAGSYPTTQSVAITTLTSGASIRYTTDSSTPSETAGTIYSVPVSISGNTTLKAIAYGSGFNDSAVTTGVYTIGSTPPPTVNFEAESLTYTPSGATASVQTDTNSSAGKWVELAGNSIGDSISYPIPSIPAGTYQLQMKWKGNNSRGILQLSVDGTNLGPTLDQYSSGQTYPTTTFGNVTFSATGTHTIKLTVTGKNSASSNYQLSADKFTFVGQ